MKRLTFLLCLLSLTLHAFSQAKVFKSFQIHDGYKKVAVKIDPVHQDTLRYSVTGAGSIFGKVSDLNPSSRGFFGLGLLNHKYYLMLSFLSPYEIRQTGSGILNILLNDGTTVRVDSLNINNMEGDQSMKTFVHDDNLIGVAPISEEQLKLFKQSSIKTIKVVSKHDYQFLVKKSQARNIDWIFINADRL